MIYTRAILDFAAAPHVLPPQVRADALRLLTDTLVVGAAGAASPEAIKLLSFVDQWCGSLEARLLTGTTNKRQWCPFMSSTPTAAFFNGFAIHCLEWDAVHEPAVVHALSVVTAALLAASDRRGGSDPDNFLTALAVGVDIASGLGIAATGPMRFFRPATAGVIGAALAVARLDGLNRDKMADVLGLAYSFAGGTMQAHAEASIALPLQIGRAAQAAIQAVDLVKCGLDGPHDVLEGPFGYTTLIEPLDLARYTGTIGQIWRISEVSTKPYPCGRASHAALATLAEAGPDIEYIEKVTTLVPPLVHRLVGRPLTDKITPAYARLCLPLLAALMLTDKVIDPRRFTLATFNNPDIRRLAERVFVEIDDNQDANALTPQRLRVDTSYGFWEVGIADTLGSPEAPMSPTQAAAKYDLCRALTPDCDPRIFDDPLSYATEPV
jgi:2-methylcitrate dehydratase PrpD